MNTRHTVERIIRANPVPDESLLHRDQADAADLLSSIMRRRDSMLTPTRRPPVTPRERIPWHRKPQFVFLAAALLVAVVIVPVMLFGGNGSEVLEEPTTSLPTTSMPETVRTTPAPEETATTSVAPVPVAFDQLLVGDHMAMKTEMVTGPDGFPVIIYYYESVEAWFDGAPSEAGMGILRCLDPECLEFETVEVPYSRWPTAEWPPLEFATLMPDGSPVFLGSESPEGASEDGPPVDDLSLLLVCSDPDCTNMERSILDPPSDPDFILHGPHVLIGENGFPVLYFVSGTPPGQPSVKQIICADRLCTDREINTLIENSYLGNLATDPEGRLILTYSADEALVCEDLTCSTGTTVVDPDTLTGIELLSSGLSPRSVIGDLEASIARLCLDPWCLRQLEVPLEHEPGLGVPADWVETWTDADGLRVLLYATFPVDQGYGDPIPVDLIVAECTDAACSSTITHRVATPVTEEDVAAGRWWDSDGAFSMWMRDDGLPLIAYGTVDGVHLIRCPDAACTPPG